MECSEEQSEAFEISNTNGSFSLYHEGTFLASTGENDTLKTVERKVLNKDNLLILAVMIAQLEGKIAYLKDNYAVVAVGGIGYKIFISAYTMGMLAGSESTTLHTHTYVREDTLALYGFLTAEELEMFELLISVSGVGPKAALGILSISDPMTIRTAILNHDASILTRVSGVGKKTAERVILDLENKVGSISEIRQAGVVAESDALEALTALGYSVAEAREALKSVSTEVKDIGDRVKMALKNLGKK